MWRVFGLMKKSFKFISFILAAVILAACTCVSAFALSDRFIESDSIRLIAGDERFDLFTKTGGKLLYTFSAGGFDEDWPEGTSRVFVGSGGYATSPEFSSYVADTENLTLTDYANCYDLDIERKFSIIENSVNGNKDVLEIRLTITNNTDENKNAGARIFLDTMVEDNDNAPLRAAGIGQVKNIVEYAGNDIPRSFQAFSDLDDPTLIGSGSFAQGADGPSAVQFTDFWKRGEGLHPEIPEDTQITDSALNIIWDERTLAPGESMTCRTYYGIGSIDINSGSELLLGATKIDGNFTIADSGTEYNPVSFTSYISNNGLTSLTDPQMSIALPDGVTAVNDKTSVSYDKLDAGEEQQTTWTVNAVPAPYERTVNITINAKSDETGDVEPIVYSYVIPAIEGAESPATPDEPTPTETEEATVETSSETEAVSETETETQKSTSSKATKDQTTSSSNEKSSTAQNSNAVKTGQLAPALILMMLALCVSAVLFIRNKRKIEK